MRSIKNADDRIFALHFTNWQELFEKLFDFDKQKISNSKLVDRYENLSFDDIGASYLGKPFLYSSIIPSK